MDITVHIVSFILSGNGIPFLLLALALLYEYQKLIRSPNTTIATLAAIPGSLAAWWLITWYLEPLYACRRNYENYQLVTRCSDGFIVRSNSSNMYLTRKLCRMATIHPLYKGHIKELDICMHKDDVEEEIRKRDAVYKMIINGLD
jgi:hypothetical protein